MNYRPSEMGKIINTRVSDYLSVSWSRIMNLLHVLLSWTWLPLTNLQASGSVWNSFQVGGIFFPLTFCSWDSPEQEAEESNITKYVLSPALIFYFHRKRRQILANESWPMRTWQQQAASTGSGEIDPMPFFTHTHKIILDTTGWNLCYTGGRSLTVSYKLPSNFRGIGLIFSRRPSLRKRAEWHSGKNPRMGVGR